jgi:hypothetical protein
MPHTINDVYPWGRSFDEYRRMFALTDEELRLHILGCADGPASFNAELSARGGCVVSCDPLYRFSAGEIRARVDATAPQLIAMAAERREAFVWREIASPEELGRVRRAAMDRFLADYDAGLAEGRYVDAALPALPFADDSFELALCSHFLLLYSEQFSREFHRDALIELCRVAAEVRVFPLLDLSGERSRHLDTLLAELLAAGFNAKLEKVPYEFQRGGDEMLRIRKRQA